MVKLVILLSGKRKSGKDFCSSKLKDALSPLNVLICGVSHNLKAIYAKNNNLDFSKLLSDGPYKEDHRLNMIKWSEAIRAAEPEFFCRDTIPMNCKDDVVIVSDCRRPSDIEYFKNRYTTLTVRVEAALEDREQRGFYFIKGVDDTSSECGLDDYIHDITLKNDRSCNLMDQISHVVCKVRQIMCITITAARFSTEM